MITGIEDRGLAGTCLGLAVAAASIGPGLRVLVVLRRPPDLLVALAIGLGVVPQSVIALGWCGLSFPVIGWLLLGVCAASYIPACTKNVSYTFVQELRKRWRESRVMCVAAVALALAALVASSMPPLIYDVVAYHLLLPQQYAMEHKVFAMPHFMPSAFPHVTSGGYLWMFLLGGGWRAAAALNWVWLPVAALAAGRLAAALGGLGAAGVAGVCLIPMALIVASSPLADLPGAALTLLAVSTAAGRAPGRWPAAGLLCGLAAATKYNAGAAALAGCAALLPFRLRSGFPAARGLAAAGLLPVVPLLLSNLLSFAAPCFPLLTSSPQAGLVAAWNRELATAPRSLMGALTWPARLAWDGPSFIRKELVQAGAGLAGLYLVAWLRRHGPALRLGLAVWGLWTIAFFGYWPLRYLLPVMGLTVAVAVVAVRGFRFGNLLLCVIMAVCAVPHVDAWTRLPYVWFRSGAAADRWLDGFRWPWPPGPVTKFLRAGLPPGAAIVPVFETQLFWAGRRLAPSLMHDRSVVFAEAAVARSAGELVVRLRRRGMTHVLLALNLDPVAAPQWLSWGGDREHGLIRALAGDRQRAVYQDETHLVLSLRRLTESGGLR